MQNFIFLVVFSYLLSAGFGLLVKQQQGLRWVDRQWRAVITWCIRTPIGWAASFLQAVARRIR